MDIADTLAPKSDQQNYEDYIAGPKTVTISEVRKGSSEQPVEVHLVEFPGKPFKPSKTVRRILAAAWGSEAAAWAGRKMTLYGDPKVRFGGDVVGGIRVSHLSHIDKAVTASLLVSKGKRGKFTVQPLTNAPQPDALAAAKSALWAAWTDGHDPDPTALADAYREHAGSELSTATAADLTAFTTHLETPA